MGQEISKWSLIDPAKIVNTCSPRHVQSVLEDAQQTIGDLLDALQCTLTALNAIGDEMTVGERYTNAGQYLLDALEPAKSAISKAIGEK